MGKKLPDKVFKRIQISQEWPEYKVLGRMFFRIPVGQELNPIEIVDNRCMYCQSGVKLLHCLGCFCESQPCCNQTTYECQCPYGAIDNEDENTLESEILQRTS